MKAAHNAFARWEYPVVSTASRAIRVINPGFREPDLGTRETRPFFKHGYGSCSNPGFRVRHFLPIFHSNDRHIFTAEMDKNSRTALCSTYFIYVTSCVPVRMINILYFLRSYYLAQRHANLVNTLTSKFHF